MTTTPSPEGLSVRIENDWKWLTSHIILIVVLALMVTGAVYLVESIVASHDAANNSKWQQILASQTVQTQSLQKQLIQDEQQWQKIQSQLLAQNANLTAEIAVRDKQTSQQEQKDATLDAQQAAQRLALDTQATPGDITVNGDNVILSLHLTRRIDSSLDLLVGTQADLADTKKQLTNETTLYTNAEADVAAQKKLVIGTQQLVTDTQQQCRSEVKALKAKQRKNIIKAVFVGIGIGLGLGIHYF